MHRFTITIDVNEKPELGEHQEPEAYMVLIDELILALQKQGITHSHGWSVPDDIK